MKPFQIFLLFSFCFLILSFVNITNFKMQNENISKDIVFLLDISKSMDVYDYNDKTRLDVAKDFIQNYVKKYPQNRYALSVFSWDVNNLLPLNTNLETFLNILNNISTKDLYWWWTNISKAYENWINRFENGWGLFLLSDFEIPGLKKKSDIINVSALNKLLNNKDISIFNIWFWKTIWWKILRWYDYFNAPIYEVDQNENEIISKLDTNNLSYITDKLHWKQIIILNKNDILKYIWETFNQIKIYTQNEEIKINYFILISYIFFLIHLILYFIDKKIWKKSL